MVVFNRCLRTTYRSRNVGKKSTIPQRIQSQTCADLRRYPI